MLSAQNSGQNPCAKIDSLPVSEVHRKLDLRPVNKESNLEREEIDRGGRVVVASKLDDSEDAWVRIRIPAGES